MSENEGQLWESVFSGSEYRRYANTVREFGVKGLALMSINDSKAKRAIAEFYKHKALATQIVAQAAVQQGATIPQQIQQQGAITFATGGITAAMIASQEAQRLAEFLVDFPALSFFRSVRVALFGGEHLDRKSTRLNSSHGYIS